MKGDQFLFRLEKEVEGYGRLGRAWTPHGVFATPAFMPVGSQGTVKALDPVDLRTAGTEVILCNAYHLYLRPGTEIIKRTGGLHSFMGWDGPVLTDSGGYQMFSLSGSRTVRPEGIEFRSHVDGARHLLTPENVIRIQEDLGSDIMMTLDHVPPYPISHREASESVAITTRWARQAKEAKKKEGAALFGIVQGSTYEDLRIRSAQDLVACGFDGYALGGLSVGEEKALTFGAIEAVTPLLPGDSPRYLMGMGTPEDIVRAVRLGVDLFDCVLPTRCARTGVLFTREGRIVIKNARYRDDGNPVDAGCQCYTCRSFSRAYLRHLFLARELLAYRLNAIHNVWYYQTLMNELRKALGEGTIKRWMTEWWSSCEHENDEREGGEILC